MSYAPPPNDAVVLSGSRVSSPPDNDGVYLVPIVSGGLPISASSDTSIADSESARSQSVASGSVDTYVAASEVVRTQLIAALSIDSGVTVSVSTRRRILGVEAVGHDVTAISPTRSREIGVRPVDVGVTAISPTRSQLVAISSTDLSAVSSSSTRNRSPTFASSDTSGVASESARGRAVSADSVDHAVTVGVPRQSYVVPSNDAVNLSGSRVSSPPANDGVFLVPIVSGGLPISTAFDTSTTDSESARSQLVSAESVDSAVSGGVTKRVREPTVSTTDGETQPLSAVRRIRTPAVVASDVDALAGQMTVQRLLRGDGTSAISTVSATLVRFTVFARDGTFDAVVMRDGEFVVELHTTPTVYDDTNGVR